MKRPTILSTIFPRLGFHYYTLAELMQSFHQVRSPNIEPFCCVHGDGSPDKLLVVPEIFPHFPVGEKMLWTSLEYRELPDESEIFTRKPKNGKKSGGASHIIVYLFDGEGPLRLFEFETEDFEKYCAELMRQPERNIFLKLTIALKDSLCDRSGKPREVEDRLCERQETVALELITVYRHWVSKVQGLSLMALEESLGKPMGELRKRYVDGLRDFKTIAPGKVLDSDSLHSTREDVWRLVCTFSTLEKGMMEYFQKHPKMTIKSLDAMVTSATEAKLPTFDHLIEWFRKEYRISDRITFKKLFEYFVYEEMRCL